MKRLIPLIAALLVSPVALAAQPQKKPDPIKVAKERCRDSVKDYMEDRDKNRDGSLTKEEFVESEIDKEEAAKAFDKANTNRDRSLSKSEIIEMQGFDAEVKKLTAEAKAKKKSSK